MPLGIGNNLIRNGGGLNPDGLALDLQFALDKTMTARKGPTPVFTRASSATFVGSNGLIQSAATNIPRFDHTSAGVCRGLLIEESRTNIALYSGAWVGNTGWSLAQATSVVSGTGPDGNNAYEVADDSTTSNVHGILNSGGTTGTAATSVVSGTTYTGSVFLKKIAGSVDWVQVTMGAGGFGSAQYANFNLSTGQVGNFAGLASGTSPRIEAFANGWYRCSISVTATTTTTTSFSVAVYSTNNTNATTRAISYNGNTANKFLAAMAQFEVGSFATSYIPTTTGSVVRSADVCSITGANFTSFYNQSEGTSFVASERISAGSSFTALARYSDNTNNNRINIGNVGNPHSIEFLIASSGTSTFSESLNTTAFKKAALAYKANDANYAVNGSLGTQDNTVTVPSTVNQFDMGSGQIVAAIRYYKKRLPNSKLVALTT
jgi:hypothetical protein